MIGHDVRSFHPGQVSCLRLDALQRRHHDRHAREEHARARGGAGGGGRARGAAGAAAGRAGAGGALRCSIKRFPESYSKQNTVLVAEA